MPIMNEKEIRALKLKLEDTDFSDYDTPETNTNRYFFIMGGIETLKKVLKIKTVRVV